MHSHRGITCWFTGLSGSGKTTLCEAVAKVLQDKGYRTEVLDGDCLRRHLGKELGFSRQDRLENIRRITFVAGLLTRNGVIVLVSAIAPYREARAESRQQIKDYLEIYVNAPLSICEQRDPKGLYRKARAGSIKYFTGIHDVYEPPERPEVECRPDRESIAESVRKVLTAILPLVEA